ncbi:glycoside hydrolase family 1 protein [Mesoplasma coleopterae]|uniref:glycoside hydrolase family 1 protein n=1 Tax=Mesoplasma coleopterae TaxID=324078 RepID=UPI000D0276B0|nr:glycoside hydrolase family 1 protein [Mesoplasma coleopterae]AVN62746.1 6-phospho-beta-glucosidase [Mesoplasma coleopterae]
MKKLEFPNDFLFGGATAANQIEGAYDIDGKTLSLLEMIPFQELEDRKNPSTSKKITKELIMEAIENKNGRHYPKRFGNDFYHRYKEDIKLFKEAGLKIFRMSISWTRIYPNGNDAEPNAKGLEFYRNVFEECKKNGLEIMVTMNHFDIPLWVLQKQLSWDDAELRDAFLKYAKTLLDEFNVYVKYWLPFNEINLFAFMMQTMNGGTEQGDKLKAILNSYNDLHKLVVTQARVIEYAKKYPNIMIGNMVADSTTYPINCDPENVYENLKMEQMKKFFYHDLMVKGEYPGYALRMFKEYGVKINRDPEEDEILKNNPVQFISFSYYMSGTHSKKESELTEGNFIKVGVNPYLKATEWGWQIDPIGLRITLNQYWDRYQIPLFVSENGIGVFETLNENKTVEDDYRIKYLADHFEQMSEAIKDGVKMIGYTMWTPIDLVSAGTNEMSKRYGLIFVDYDDYHKGTGNRFKKKSFEWFKNFMKTKEL